MSSFNPIPPNFVPPSESSSGATEGPVVFHTRPEDSKIQGVAQGPQGIAQGPMAPPSNLEITKPTLLDKFALPMLPGAEQNTARLAIKEGRQTLMKATPDEQKRQLKEALLNGDTQLVKFYLRPTGGLTLQQVFGDWRTLADELISSRPLEGTYHSRPLIDNECLKFLFRHPALTDQDRTAIACELISTGHEAVALKYCLESLTDISLQHNGRTILKAAEDNAPLISREEGQVYVKYGDGGDDDDAYDSDLAAWGNLDCVISYERFAAQRGLKTQEDKDAYLAARKP